MRWVGYTLTYRVLEEEIIPCFYHRNEQGLPTGWVKRMRESMGHLTAKYSSNRMLREYTEDYYMPLFDAYRRRSMDVNISDELESWHTTLQQHWQRVHFGNVKSIHDKKGYYFEVQVYLDEIPAQAVSVELYADSVTEGGDPLCQTLNLGVALAGSANAYVYSGCVAADRPASDYTPRIIAIHPQANVPLEANMILWYR